MRQFSTIESDLVSEARSPPEIDTPCAPQLNTSHLLTALCKPSSSRPFFAVATNLQSTNSTPSDSRNDASVPKLNANSMPSNLRFLTLHPRTSALAEYPMRISSPSMPPPRGITYRTFFARSMNHSPGSSSSSNRLIARNRRSLRPHVPPMTPYIIEPSNRMTSFVPFS